MAIEPAFFDHLVVNDGYFPSFLQQNESKDEVLCASLEAGFDEELQFQEALRFSFMEANSGRKIEPSPQVLEKGESSLSSCEICLDRKEEYQIIKNESSGLIVCLSCSKTLELSKKEWCSKELSMDMGSRIDTGKSLAADASNGNPTPKTEAESGSPGAVKAISLNSALDEGELGFDESKHTKMAETIAAKQQGPQSPNPKARGDADVDQNPGNADSEMPADRGNGCFQTRSRYFKSTDARSLDRPPVGQRSNKQGGIDRPPGKGSDAGQERVANDIQINHIDVVGDLSDADAFDDNDESDSDPSGKSPENTKKSTPMKEFLVILEKLAPADVNETTRQWLCPVCEEGSGATKGYQGLWALILHAKTKPGKRVKLHQELAQLFPINLPGNCIDIRCSAA